MLIFRQYTIEPLFSEEDHMTDNNSSKNGSKLVNLIREHKKLTVILCVVLIIVIAGVTVLIVTGSRSGTQSGMPGGMPGGMAGGFPSNDTGTNYAMVKTVHPEYGDVSVTSSLTGEVSSSAAVYVYSEGSGDVTAVNVKVGDKVKQGDVLAEINTGTVESARNSMESAKINAEQAAANLERMEILYQGGDITEQEHEQYVNNARTSQLQYDTAKSTYEKQLRGSSPSSPIDGIVQSVGIEVNDKVGGNEVLFVIVGDGSKRTSFYVSERIMKHLRPGDEMNAVKDSNYYPGRITSVNTIVDPVTGLFEITAELDDTDDIAIGSTVKLLITSDRTENALLVPVDALYYSGGDAYLYTVADGKAVMTPVVVGLYDDSMAEILSGVDTSDEVVSTWSNNLYDGANVRIMGKTDENAGSQGELPADGKFPEGGEFPADGNFPTGKGPGSGDMPQMPQGN